MSNLTATPITVSVHKSEDSPIFGNSATHVTVCDDGGGPFIKLTQFHEKITAGVVILCQNELAMIAKVADELIEVHDPDSNYCWSFENES